MSTHRLSPEWEDWVVGNALDGVEAAELVCALVQGGVSPSVAQPQVAAILASPAMRWARNERAQRERREQLFQLMRALEEAHDQGVERRSGVGAEEFYDRYVRNMRPVVLTDLCADWPALTRWDPTYLSQALGDAQLKVCVGRDALPHPDRDFEGLVQTMTMAKYAAMVADAGVSNDLYMIANNHVAALPEFAALMADLNPPEHLLEGELACSFWFGPAGTFTPLHHDNTNILFCQLRGRKRFRLVAPWSIALSSEAEGFYARRTLEEHLEAGERAYEIELQPGQALFLPGWWWHEVRSLDQSVSLSFLNFRQPGAFDWYRPGSGQL